MNFTDTFRQLLSCASPSGYEAPGAAVIAELARPYCDEITIDALGNVICHKKGAGKKLLFAAHLDVIGFMVTHFEENGFVGVVNVGGHTACRLSGKRVRFPGGARGVLCERAEAKLAEKTAGESKMTDVYLDLGAASEAEARKLVRVGDIAVYDYEARAIGGDCLMSPYCDNLASCAAMLCAMSQVESSGNDLYFVFTAQEEVGLNGSKAAAFSVAPDMAIAIDLTRAGDCPGAAKGEVRLGAGPTVKIKDSSVICTPVVVEMLRRAAEENGIAYQDEVLLAGGTDTFSMLVSRGGVPAGCISIPGRYIHSTAETISIKDAEQAAKLLACAAKREI